MPDLGNSMDLPFEQNPEPVPLSEAVLDLDAVLMSGGVTVMAATVPVPGYGVKPALVFRFVDFGQFYRPVFLVMDDGQLAKLRPLISEAIHAAREAAKQGPR